MNEIYHLDNLLKKYESNPILRGLVQLIPFGIGSAVETGLLTQVHNIRIDRLHSFFEELANGKVDLSPELIESEDFLHCFFATTKATLNSRRREKIRLLARLLIASTKNDIISDVDEYEEYLQIMDEITYREFMILFILSEYEGVYSHQAEGIERLHLFRDEFINELVNKLKIPEDDINPCLIRLARTGCYELYMGKYFAAQEGEGQTTQRFSRLKEFVAVNSEN